MRNPQKHNSTTKPKQYYMKRTLLLMLCCLVPTLAQADEYEMIWAPGVSLEKGWKDVNKVMDTDINTGDSSLCWAAAASNVGAWWQEYNASHLVNHQEGIPQGEQAIFDAFNDTFFNKGFHEYWGLRWFMDGADEMYEPYSPDEPDFTPASWIMENRGSTRSGGYYNGIVENLVSSSVVEGFMQRVVDDEFGQAVVDVIQLEPFTQQLVDAVTSGAVALGIVGEVPQEEGELEVFGHAIALWGLKLNKTTGYIESMWVTDSDDKVTYGKDLELFELTCTRKDMQQEIDDEGGYANYQVYAIEDNLPEEAERWYGKYNEYIDSFAVLKANVQWVVPEPATGTLGLLALAALAARRRRKG